MMEKLPGSTDEDLLVAGGAVTFPLWAQTLSMYLQFALAIFGLVYLAFGIYIRHLTVQQKRDEIRLAAEGSEE